MSGRHGVGADDDLHAADLASLLDLEVLERGDGVTVFLGRVRALGADWPVLYGGQVAAQSLIAAGSTVPEGRRPHSLHGYFLRPGRIDRKVQFRVDHDRDGRSYSARHVSAMQDGRVIFSMLASFVEHETPSVLDDVPVRASAARGPDECPAHPVDPHIDARAITSRDEFDGRHLEPDALWVRVPTAMPADPLTQAAVLTYLSDLGSGFGQVEDPEVGIGGPSLDHALWFHEPIATDEWLLLDMWPVAAVKGRGVYHGTLRDRSGRLGVMIAQENLLRTYFIDERGSTA
ncbi:MAG: acyl-CoA thioesterase [Acidimicrobiia bacterium]